MKRIIKFRMFSHNGMGGHDDALETMGCGNPTNIPIMQFTGLQDKNGVDIYEGDICSYSNMIGTHVGRIEYCNSRTMFLLRFPDENWCELDDIKIIGNIHENPELIKDES